MRLVERKIARSLLKAPRYSFSSISRRKIDDLTVYDRMQFSKKRLTDFGDLPAGEIPDALKYSKPVFQKTLSNGITAVA
jgi:processing peptidase subunit beta